MKQVKWIEVKTRENELNWPSRMKTMDVNVFFQWGRGLVYVCLFPFGMHVGARGEQCIFLCIPMGLRDMSISVGVYVYSQYGVGIHVCVYSQWGCVCVFILVGLMGMHFQLELSVFAIEGKFIYIWKEAYVCINSGGWDVCVFKLDGMAVCISNRNYLFPNPRWKKGHMCVSKPNVWWVVYVYFQCGRVGVCILRFPIGDAVYVYWHWRGRMSAFPMWG